MWFGVAPSSKDAYPHRLERDKRFEAERHHVQQSSGRGGPPTHQVSTSGPLSSRQRGVHGEKTLATPRRQLHRPREGMQEDRSRDSCDGKETKRADDKKQNLQPEHVHVDEQGTQGRTNEEELMQLMEGCQIGGAVANGEVGIFVQQQNQGQKSTKESEARLPGGLIGGSSRPPAGVKTSQTVGNQGDIGTFLVSQLTSRSRRPSIHRATQSPRIDIDSLEESNNSNREWTTTPAPFASLRPENLVGHAVSVCALVAYDNRFIVSCSVDGSVKVWSQVTFECLRTIYDHRDVVSCVDLNMRWLISGSHDNTLRLYDSTSSSFTLLHVLTGHTGHVTHVQLPCSLPNYILSGSDDFTLRLWNAELGQFIYELRAHHSRVTCFDVQPGHICSGAADGSVCFWDISSLSSSPEHPPDHHLPCARIYYAHKTTVQCIVDMSSSRATSTNRSNSELCSVVITGSNDNTIQLFSAINFAHLGRLDNVGSPVYAAAPLTNDRLLCSTKDGRLLLYGNMFRPTVRKTPAVLQLALKWISSLQVCGDLVACSSEELLYVVDTSRMCMVLVFETQHSFITCTRWIHKGALITAGQDNVIKLWTIA